MGRLKNVIWGPGASQVPFSLQSLSASCRRPTKVCHGADGNTGVMRHTEKGGSTVAMNPGSSGKRPPSFLRGGRVSISPVPGLRGDEVRTHTWPWHRTDESVSSHTGTEEQRVRCESPNELASFSGIAMDCHVGWGADRQDLPLASTAESPF